MNKRQRKKQVKKQCVAFDTELQKGLMPFVGQPLTPT
jgi:hypothetical protein